MIQRGHHPHIFTERVHDIHAAVGDESPQGQEGSGQQIRSSNKTFRNEFIF